VRFSGTCLPNFKLVSLTILELLAILAFNAHNLRGHVTLATPLFGKKLLGIIMGLSLRAWVPNLKFVPSTVLELLAFNAQKFKGPHDLATPPFRKQTFRNHNGTFPASIVA